MKYLIVKGELGFGDRLQTLKMCVRYAITHNLQIYVDWTDPIWSHSGETFYTYFKLVNMPVLNSIADIPPDASVYPAFWKNKLTQPFTLSMLKTNPEIQIEKLNEKKFDEDVIVYPSIGYRTLYPNSDFFANVFRVIDPRIQSKIKERQLKYDLKNVTGIHLRGTDRATTINKLERMRGMRLRMVSGGLMGGGRFISVSDDVEFTNLWKRLFPTFPLLTEEGSASSSGAVHTQPKDKLRISKDVSNVNLLVDFFTLASCNNVISTSKDSRFAQEAQRLHPFIAKVL